MISDRTRTVIIGVVTFVWATNFMAGLVIEDYKPSESINGIFMAIVGGLFALGARASGGNGRHRGSEESQGSSPSDGETSGNGQ
jgi:hypothetical protein